MIQILIGLDDTTVAVIDEALAPRLVRHTDITTRGFEISPEQEKQVLATAKSSGIRAAQRVINQLESDWKAANKNRKPTRTSVLREIIDLGIKEIQKKKT